MAEIVVKRGTEFTPGRRAAANRAARLAALAAEPPAASEVG